MRERLEDCFRLLMKITETRIRHGVDGGEADHINQSPHGAGASQSGRFQTKVAVGRRLQAARG